MTTIKNNRISFLITIGFSFFFSLYSHSQNIDQNKRVNQIEIHNNDHEHKEELTPCGEDLFWKYTSEGFHLTNKMKEKIGDMVFTETRSFSNGKAAVYNGKKWGFVDVNGRVASGFIYDFIYDYFDYVSFVVKNDKWFIVDDSEKIIKELDIDFSWGYNAGRAKILKGYQIAYIDLQGNILDKGWETDSSYYRMSMSNSSTNNAVTARSGFCPPNFDFENCDFTNWTCYEGSISRFSPSLNQTSPLLERHELYQSSSQLDTYGGFPVSPPGGSGCSVRLGKPNQTGAKVEKIVYRIQIPPGVTDYSFTYQYALVFENPPHPNAIEQPSFKVTLTDEVSGQIIDCASVNYTAGFGGATFFTQSNIGRNVFYKPWTPVFVNLSRFQNRTLLISFSNLDCIWGGHWCYAYLDVFSCDYNGLSATNSCTTPVTTLLEGPPGYTAYQWSSNANLADTLSLSRQAILSPGLPVGSTAFLRLIPENGLACADTVSVAVTPNRVFADFNTPATQCFENNSFSFLSSSTTNGSPLTGFAWDFGDGNSASGANVAHSYSRADTFMVKLTATSAVGCTDDKTVPVVIKKSPTIVVSGTEICEGSSATVVLSGADTFAWNPRNGLVFTSPVNDTVFFGFNNTSVYNVSAIENETGCTTDTLIRVRFFPSPLADFDQPAPQCLRGNLFNFNNQTTISSGTTISSYLWEFGDDSISTSIRPQHTYVNGGVYSVSLYASSSNGCKDTVVKLVTVNANPSANILAEGPMKVCFSDTVHLYANSSPGSGSMTLHQWLVNGNPLPGANQNSVFVTQPGSFSYQIISENSNSCRDTSLITPVIVHPSPVGQISTIPSNRLFICDGENVELRAINSNAATFQWYFSDLNQSQPPIPLPGADSSFLLASVPGFYSLKMTSITDPVCIGDALDTIRLQLLKKPIPDFSFPLKCTNMPVQFNNLTDTSMSGTATWSWDFGDLSSPSSAFSPTHSYVTGTGYSVKLTATPTNCPSLDSSIVKIVNVEQPISGIRYPHVNAVRSLITPLQSRTFADRILWSPSIGLNAANISNPKFRYNNSVEYLIRMETNAGCVTYDTQLVRIFTEANIQVPTAFSPNNDGHNDKLDVFLIGIEKLLFFKVFNRWGQLLFETKDLYHKWDGTFRGAPQLSETYVWIAEGIDLNGNKVQKRGQTILLK